MVNFAKCIVAGRLGKDPESRALGDGSVTNFSVAVSRKFKDRSGEQKEETTWYRCSAFGRLAEVAADYLHKGDPVLVEGDIRERTYTNNAGQEVRTWELNVSNLQLLGSPQGGKGRDDRGDRYARDRDEPPPRRPPPRDDRNGRRPPPRDEAAPRSRAPQGSMADMDDDIPF